MEKLKITDVKVISFFGSPHSGGHSSALHNSFLHNFADNNILRVSAYKRNITPCIACGFCKTAFACTYNDMDEILTVLKEADILTMSWPVYFSSAPSPMKAIIDRFQPLWEASISGKLDLKPKKIFYFLTAGSDYKTVFDPSLTILKYIAATFKSEIFETGSVKLPGLDSFNGQKNFENALNKLNFEKLLL